MKGCVLCGRPKQGSEFIDRCCARCDDLVGDVMADLWLEMESGLA